MARICLDRGFRLNDAGGAIKGWDRRNHFYYSMLQALAKHYGRDIRLVIEAGDPHSETPAQEQARREQERQVAAVEAIEGDSNVRALQETFDARIQTDSIHPVD